MRPAGGVVELAGVEAGDVGALLEFQYGDGRGKRAAFVDGFWVAPLTPVAAVAVVEIEVAVGGAQADGVRFQGKGAVAAPHSGH